jgi:D-alanine-D-alanine ligase
MGQPRVKHILVIHGDRAKPFPYYPGGDWASNDNGTLEKLHEALGSIDGYRFTFLCDHDTLFDDLRRLAGTTDMVLQLCDDGYRNDPFMAVHVCALLDLLGLRYTGSGVKAMALTGDKQVQLDIARGEGLPVPWSVRVEPGQPPPDVDFPAIVKPAEADGSLGITRKSVVRDRRQLLDAVAMIRDEFRLGGAVLVQRYLPGPDLNAAMLGNPEDRLTPLPITEEDYSSLPEGYPRICGHESKWDPSSPYWKIATVPTRLASRRQEWLVDHCRRLFVRLGMRDYARFDWRLDGDGVPHFLEANANCGWCWDGHLAKAATLGGLSYGDLFRTIIGVAERRYSGAAT